MTASLPAWSEAFTGPTRSGLERALPLGRLERAQLDVGEALDLQIELEEVWWDRPEMLGVRPERVRADRERPRVRRDKNEWRAGRERATARAKDLHELARKDVLGEMARVQPVNAPRLHLPEMRERVDLVRLEPLLAALGDHARVEVDAISADPFVPQELKEDAAA